MTGNTDKIVLKTAEMIPEFPVTNSDLIPIIELIETLLDAHDTERYDSSEWKKLQSLKDYAGMTQNDNKKG